MREERASTSPKRSAAGDGRSNQTKKASTNSTDASPTSAKLAENLVSTPLHVFQDFVRTLPYQVAKEFISNLTDMRKLAVDLTKKNASLKKYDDGIIVNDEKKSYIPGSVRTKLANIVTVPSKLKDNQRPGGVTAEAQTIMDGLNGDYIAYLEKCGKACENLLKLEIKQIHYEVMERALDMLFDLLVGLTVARPVQFPDGATYTAYDVAIYTAITIFRSTDYLPNEDFDVIKGSCASREQLCQKLVTYVNTTWTLDAGQLSYDAVCAKFEEEYDQENAMLIKHYINIVLKPFIRGTSGFIKNEKTATDQKSNNADLKVLYGKKKTNQANAALADAMETDTSAKEAMEEIAAEAARKAVNRTRRQIEASMRKNLQLQGIEPKPCSTHPMGKVETTNKKSSRRSNRNNHADGRVQGQLCASRKRTKRDPTAQTTPELSSQARKVRKQPPPEVLPEFRNILPEGWSPPKQKKSRRIQQRKARRAEWKELTREARLDRFYDERAKSKLKQYVQDTTEWNGFCVDPEAPLWKNKSDYIRHLTVEQYDAMLTNKVMHNYCDEIPPPAGTKSLLSEGLKFTLRHPRPTNRINSTFNRFENDVRRIVTFRNKPDNNNYIPKLYIKSGWIFDPVDNQTETALANFRDAVVQTRRQYLRPRTTNLTPIQLKVLNTLKQNDYFMVIEADKNLGAVILRRSLYIERGVKEHLHDTTVYQPLTKLQMNAKSQQLKFRYKRFIATYECDLSEPEKIYLSRALEQFPHTKYARFRMSMKVHKSPWKMRPIVCCAGTFMNALSKWLDYQFSKLIQFIPSYIKDSDDLLKQLKSLGRLPPSALLFTMDAVSMYSNIDTDHAIEVIGEWLDGLDLVENGIFFPLAAVKAAMELVMRNNIFEWGDLYFLQLTGTAMGTSAACLWATIYFAIREAFLLKKYKTELALLPFYKRFIDDVFGIWLGTQERYIEFQNDVNNYGILRWTADPLAISVNFMDLTISIDSSFRIQTKTYQKAMNLYQYIPPSSAHPRNMMKGIVYGLLRKYKVQNSLESDYINQAKLLFQRLVARGWKANQIKQYILDADAKISSLQQLSTPKQTTPLTNKEQVFLHWIFHPNDIPRRTLRNLYDIHLKEHFEQLGIKQFTIAYSSPPSIRSELVRAKLHQAPGEEASKYYRGELTS